MSDKRIVIYHTEAEHACETCGSSWEDSYHTFFQGEQIGEYAHAHCFGAENTTYEKVLYEVLKRLGYEVVVVDGE